ncbi:hypothetical protein VP01_5165g1 [Puccinia sorghi]|uniref:DDE Tnp4 domain-containing protein n=1 Tax=Puccinia sorghi TaxID=27349 RepID=A0A0L6UKW3_9BASI|nr:hypothetical protein VP01_5165g1 [Puccinia sorghi]
MAQLLLNSNMITLSGLAFWHHRRMNDARAPLVRFVGMSLANLDWLSDELRDKLNQDPLGRREPLSVEAQVAMGLYRLSHGTTYVTIGHVFSIGKETADRASGRFVNAILKVFRKRTVLADQWMAIKDSFKRRHGIPQIVGAINGTHIPLAIPPHDDRKGWASIVFQCVVGGAGTCRLLPKRLRAGACRLQEEPSNLQELSLASFQTIKSEDSPGQSKPDSEYIIQTILVEPIVIMSDLNPSSFKLVTKKLDVNNFSTWRWGIITALGYKNVDDYILDEHTAEMKNSPDYRCGKKNCLSR